MPHILHLFAAVVFRDGCTGYKVNAEREHKRSIWGAFVCWNIYKMLILVIFWKYLHKSASSFLFFQNICQNLVAPLYLSNSIFSFAFKISLKKMLVQTAKSMHKKVPSMRKKHLLQVTLWQWVERHVTLCESELTERHAALWQSSKHHVSHTHTDMPNPSRGTLALDSDVMYPTVPTPPS